MQLTTLISHFRGEVKEQPDTYDDVAMLIKVAADSLTRQTAATADSDAYDNDVSERLSFLFEKVSLLFTSPPRYSTELMIIIIMIIIIIINVF
jgi:hypothetical protein